MKARLGTAASVTVVVLLGSGWTATTPGSPVLLPTCGNSSFGGLVAPVAWDDGCTEQTDLVHAQWRNWGHAVATAHGLTQYSPDVVRFAIVVYPVHAVAWRIRQCADGHHRLARYYTRVRLTFTLLHPDYLYPSGHAVQTDALQCYRR